MDKMKIRKGNYKRCWKYLKESQNYFLIVLLIFSFSFIIGFLFPVFLVDMISEFIEQIIAKTEGMNFLQLLVFILQNNLMTAFFGLLLGVILGLLPLLLSFLNGYVLGFVANISIKAVGLSSLWRLFPHGIFELPALIISLGLGLKLGMFVFAKPGKRKSTLLYNLENSLRVFLFVIIPLLIIAAFIETILIFLLG